MMGWLKDLGSEWGRWIRRKPTGWPKTSLMGKIKELGAVGAAIKAHEQAIPIQDMPDDIAEFHYAWGKLDRRHKYLLWVFHALPVKPEEKARLLGVSKSTMYERMTEAQDAINYGMKCSDFIERRRLDR